MANERLEGRLVEFLSANGLTLQEVIDTFNSRYAALWFPNFFRMLTPTVNLDFTTIIGKDRIDAMAPVIARDSEIPLRGNQGLEKLQGEVPPIALMRSMTANQKRELEILLRSSFVSNQVKLNQIFSILFDHFSAIRNSIMKRVDGMCMEGVSSGVISVSTATNNAEGISFEVPLLTEEMEEKQKIDSALPWTDPDADILGDFEKTREKGIAAGIATGRVVIKRNIWLQMLKNKGLSNFIKGYRNPGSNARYAFTRSTLNEALIDNEFAPIEVIDEYTATMKDGKESRYESWNKNNAIFLPEGQLGVIHTALADEELTPDPGVKYSKVGNILMSTWSQRRPTTEFFQGELNAFPGIESIDKILYLDTTKGA